MFFLPVSGYHGDGLVVTSGKAAIVRKGSGSAVTTAGQPESAAAELQSEMAAADYGRVWRCSLGLAQNRSAVGIL
jgi:hypothetical protein